MTCFVENEANIFKALSESELHFLVGTKQQIKYNVKETIIKQNTSSTFVICMRSGLAKVFIEGEKGKNLIVKIIGRGDFISGGGLFNGNVQHFTISALTPVTCCLIDASKLTNLFAENNSFAIELLRNHTKQNNYLLSKMVSLTQKYMPGRVAETLLYLKNEIYKKQKFTMDLSRQELAEMSNMTKESLVRILQQFKESNLIKTQGSEIEIIDEGSLNHISKNG
jgi:CRP/FNR family transcriptional regulator